MMNHIYSIDFELTGSELIAELKEAGEIKKYMPTFNVAQRRKKYRYGIFISHDENGYSRLSSALLNPDKKPVLQFTTKRWSDKALQILREKNKLFQENRISMGPEQYNQKVNAAIKKYFFNSPNLLIIDKGRNYDEKSVVQIENGNYVGHGYFSTDESQISSPLDIISFINKDYNNPNKEQIIRKYLKKQKRLKLIEYTPEYKQ